MASVEFKYSHRLNGILQHANKKVRGQLKDGIAKYAKEYLQFAQDGDIVELDIEKAGYQFKIIGRKINGLIIKPNGEQNHGRDS